MEMTFEDGMQESMLPIFDMYADEDGIARMIETDEPAPTFNGHEPIQASEIGGFVKDPKTGETVLLRDHFTDMVDFARAEEKVGELTSFLR